MVIEFMVIEFMVIKFMVIKFMVIKFMVIKLLYYLKKIYRHFGPSNQSAKLCRIPEVTGFAS